MRNLWRKSIVTGGIAVALMAGPGIGMANAAPLQLPMQWETPEPQEPQEPPEPEPHPIVQLVEALAELELPELSL
jgi:hypothetical protein